jgi:hypothetical protein
MCCLTGASSCSWLLNWKKKIIGLYNPSKNVSIQFTSIQHILQIKNIDLSRLHLLSSLSVYV